MVRQNAPLWKGRITRPGQGPGPEPIELNSGPIDECAAHYKFSNENEVTHIRAESRMWSDAKIRRPV